MNIFIAFETEEENQYECGQCGDLFYGKKDECPTCEASLAYDKDFCVEKD